LPFEAGMSARIPVLLLLPWLLCGCVGYVTLLARERAVPVTSAWNAESLTAEQVLPARRAPDAKYVDPEGYEVWAYQGERRWVGIVPLLVVPLPLLLPLAHDSTTLRIRDGRVVSARERKVEARQALCAVAMGPCSAPGCHRDP
jgi:hypothetical protein